MRLHSTHAMAAAALCLAGMSAAPAYATEATSRTSAPAPLYRVTKVAANDVLNVRHGPSSGHDIVAQLPADGGGISITGACRAQWCPIRHTSGEGWVYRGYLAPEERTASVGTETAAAALPAETLRQPPQLAQRAASPPEQAFRYFVAQGWGEHHAAGIVGNLQAECGQTLNCSNGSGGLAQWRGDRVTRFQKVFGYPFARAKFADQLAYIHWELTHPTSPWRDSGHALRRANDAASAAALFDAHYERSSGSTRGARMANARNLLKRFGNRATAAN